MKIFIEPNDVLMFRDGRPFSGGDDHFARGVFPPPPSTFYGALRSKILSVKYPQYDSFALGDIPDTVAREIGTPSSKGSLAITNFLLGKRDGRIRPIFPIPKDMVKIKGSDDGKFFVLTPDERLKNVIRSNFPSDILNPLWLKIDQPIEDVSGFLSLEQFEKYLSGDVPSEIINNKAIYEKEERTGIGKDRIRRATKIGALYNVEYFRLNENTGFIIEMAGVEGFPKEGLLRLGGDHRSAFYHEAEFSMPDKEEIKKRVGDRKQFKIVLLTPAIFNNGWMPEWINADSYEGYINTLRVRLISAAIGRSISIGGFDIVKKKPKEMKKAVPAGSVYYFELKGGNIENVFRTLWLKSISDEKKQEGFGTTIIGGC